ncbi:hypothetical protein LTR78_001422 [Recurvomyces mirabilis]|uniref:Alpha/beta hydrolase fold-3 domain-containing protein n=1 Tax=Recurvomyces mirabilis TaxID=574656 RepID=A0AAE0WW81_9PEZI|nr:hypothetical protein LTR78_001422 [Recurvomyces mirabilis]KAK5161400.1 hypothetical protein LTS14_001196 [Recurvomyces mirabilis]
MAPSTIPEGYVPEGRLGNDDSLLVTDPRVNQKLAVAMKAIGLDKAQPESPLTLKSPMEEIKEAIGQSEGPMQVMYDAADMSLPGDDKLPEVEHSRTTIKAEDGKDVTLHIFRVKGTEGEKRPCVLYSHGGGMTIINTFNPVHAQWCTSLAQAGVVAIMVDFRNAYTKDKHNPFPIGLNDCATAARYISEHKSEFGISKLILQGESGGGNLAIATALKAKKEGWVKGIDGVFGCIPYISNAWGWPKERLVKELPSAVASNGYFLGLKWMELMGHYYTPNEKDAVNPLAWPYHATEEDVKGLPPHFIVVDELDPLRDEGMAYYRKLTNAGVVVHAQMNLGLAHGTWLMMRKVLPEAHQAMVDAVVAFAKRV